VTKEFGHNLRFGFNETRARVDVVSGPTTNPELSGSLITLGGTVKTIGLPGAPLTVPVATIGGLIKGPSRGLELEPSSYSLVYEYSRQVGVRNELFAGVEGRFLRFKFDRLGGLTYAFPNISSARTGTPSSVTFLSDLSQPGPFTSGSGPRHARQEYFMGYTQMVSEFRKAGDPGDPRNEPALKVTFGLRYDYFGAVRERDNRAILVDPESHAILPGGTAFYRTSKLNLQPRIGLAYRLAESSFFRNTVLRAGVGIYSGVGRMGDSVLPIESERFSTGINGGSFPLTSAEVVRSFVENPDTRQFQPLAFARDFVGVERAYKWDAQLTHTLYGYDLSVLYAGNVGRNLPLANLANKIVSVTTNPDPTKAAIVVREFDIVRGGQLFKPFGEFFFRTSEGHSSYNGLTIQFKRNRRADSSLEPWLKQAVMNLNVQYTLSRNVGNVSGTIVSNPFQRNADFGYNAADARHNFKVSAVYDLWSALRRTPTNPFWGWKIMPSLKVSSGLPLIVRLNRPDIVYVDNAGNVFATPAVGRTAVINTPGGGESGGARTPDLIPGVNPYLRNGLEVLNPAAFAIPAPGQFGNLRRGQLRGPAIVQLDLGLRRNIFNSEKSKLSGEFQIDLYNVFNRANFINPTAALPGLLGTSTSDNQLQPGRPFTKASAGSFGILSAADVGRVIQFSFTVRLNQGFTK
jgi:hypothetical protein